MTAVMERDGGTICPGCGLTLNKDKAACDGCGASREFCRTCGTSVRKRADGSYEVLENCTECKKAL